MKVNVLLPSMGSSVFFKENFFPKLLYEIRGKTMLEHVIDNYMSIESMQYIFVFRDEDCKKFHIDDSVKILNPDARVIRLKNQTAGALCTCLMAIDYINNDEPLVIANSDQIIETDYKDVIQSFTKRDADAGVITFPSIHPRWSYVRKEGDEVVEVAEKRPLSKNAIAGFYYFKKGKDFIRGAENAIKKRNSLDGRFFISASLNELILLGEKVSYYDIEAAQYKSFYSPEKIKEYEEAVK